MDQPPLAIDILRRVGAFGRSLKLTRLAAVYVPVMPSPVMMPLDCAE
jgi:hypothetical protein